MASKKVVDSTLYHLSPKGFWKKFRDVVVVNPQISSGLPLPSEHRYPPPASRPEKAATPATQASDPAQNPYWKRDVRRAYPRLSVINQSDLSTLLLQRPENQAVAAPDHGSEAQPTVPAHINGVELSEAIATIASNRQLFSTSSLPPSLPIPHKRWIPERAPDAPHDPNAYFPMSLYK